MPRSRSCSWIAIRPPPVPPSAAPEPCETSPCRRSSGSPSGRAERVPALARAGEQVEVVLVGVGVVEVAGRPVRRAAGVAAGEPLEHDGRSPRRVSAHAVDSPMTPPPTTTTGTRSLIPRSSQATVSRVRRRPRIPLRSTPPVG